MAATVVGLLVAYSGVAVAAELPVGGTFSDDNGSHHEPYIEALVAAGLTKGCSDSEFCPDRATTRAEMVTLWMRVLDLDTSSHPYQGHFRDVPDGEWYTEYVESAYEMGLIARYDDASFFPDEIVTRAKIAEFLGGALGASSEPAVVGYFVDVPVDAGYAPFVERLYELGITVGCQTDPLSYCPTDPVTRGQLATMVANALGLEPIYPPLPPGAPPTTIRTTTTCPPG